MLSLAEKVIINNIERYKRSEINFNEEDSSLKFLDLSNLHITKLPKCLIECFWIEEISLENNKDLQDLSLLANLKNLKRVYLSKTGIHDFSVLNEIQSIQILDLSWTAFEKSEQISKLANLERLICGFSNLHDISEFKNFHKLKGLYLPSTQVEDIWPISENYPLENINFSGCKISCIDALMRLNHIEYLNLSYNKIKYINALSHHKTIETLFLNATNIKDFSPLSEMKELKVLDISDTKANNVAFARNLTQLKTIYFNNTEVFDLTPLSVLKGLQYISANDSKVADLTPIAESFFQNNRLEQNIEGFHPFISRKKNIQVSGCPLMIPPFDLVYENQDNINNFFEDIKSNGGEKLNEIKVVLLGEGSSGKTSLVKQLLGEKFDLLEEPTLGIDVKETNFLITDQESVKVRFWDFGGQEIMYATHQFFLSHRCIYIVVSNSRNDEKIEKWLKFITSFGGRSPVLVVISKIDENPSFDLNRNMLSDKYSQIKGFYRVSNLTGEGINIFKMSLVETIGKSEIRNAILPRNWIKIKNHFVHASDDYIDFGNFNDICKNNELNNSFNKKILLRLLNDLGILIAFNSIKSFDVQILNPHWITSGVYQVINSKYLAKNKGVFSEEDFDELIDESFQSNNKTFNKIKLHFIIRLMQEFSLCFSSEKNKYIIPQLLPVSEKNLPTDGSTLTHVISFPEFVPDSVFLALMAKLSFLIRISAIWRTGIIFSINNLLDAVAKIRFDKEDRKIIIEVIGNDCRKLLTFIRKIFRETIDKFSGLNFQEMVPIPQCKEFIEYDYLIEAEKSGEEGVFIKSLKKRIKIKDLLDGTEEPSSRNPLAFPIKVVIVSDESDIQFLATLRTVVKPLTYTENIHFWDKSDILPGHNIEKTIEDKIRESHIVICLISAQFIASDFYKSEQLKIAITAEKRSEKIIIPLKIRECSWENTQLHNYKSIPEDWINQPLDRDKSWTEVAGNIKNVIERVKVNLQLQLLPLTEFNKL